VACRTQVLYREFLRQVELNLDFFTRGAPMLSSYDQVQAVEHGKINVW
jgi:hypothetical protein